MILPYTQEGKARRVKDAASSIKQPPAPPRGGGGTESNGLGTPAHLHRAPDFGTMAKGNSSPTRGGDGAREEEKTRCTDRFTGPRKRSARTETPPGPPEQRGATQGGGHVARQGRNRAGTPTPLWSPGQKVELVAKSGVLVAALGSGGRRWHPTIGAQVPRAIINTVGRQETAQPMAASRPPSSGSGQHRPAGPGELLDQQHLTTRQSPACPVSWNPQAPTQRDLKQADTAKPRAICASPQVLQRSSVYSTEPSAVRSGDHPVTCT